MTITYSPSSTTQAVLSNGVTAFTFDSNGIQSGVPLSFRNELINGAFAIDQRNAGAAQTITAAAALAYTVDRWYAYCTGANVTGQQVAGTSPNAFNYRFTGAASVTKIGFAQRIERLNSQDLAGRTATLAVDLASSSLTTVTWTAWYANTNDTFGTLASPTRTQIATGTFTITSALTRYSTNITVPSAATTGIEIEFSVGALLGSQTWTIGRAQLEGGSAASSFEYRPIGFELGLCQRYYEILNSSYSFAVFVPNGSYLNKVAGTWTYQVQKRATPSLSQISGSTVGVDRFGIGAATISAIGLNASNDTVMTFDITLSASYTTGERMTLAGNKIYQASAEL